MRRRHPLELAWLPAPLPSLVRMLRYRHGVSAWHGDVNGRRISMFTSAPRS